MIQVWRISTSTFNLHLGHSLPTLTGTRNWRSLRTFSSVKKSSHKSVAKWCHASRSHCTSKSYNLLGFPFQLAKEAVQSRSKIPHIVVGNQILSHVSFIYIISNFCSSGNLSNNPFQLFPGLQLAIALRHSTNKDKRVWLIKINYYYISQGLKWLLSILLNSCRLLLRSPTRTTS